MLSIEEIRSLLARSAGEGKVLSVYLDTDSATGLWKSKMYSLQKNLDSMQETLEKQDKVQFKAEREKLEKFLETFKAHGKGLAVFSSGPQKLWWTTEINSSVPNDMAFNLMPKVTPLIEYLDEYQRFCAVTVDNESARILLIKMSEIEEVRNLKDFVPGKHKQTEFNARLEQKHLSMVQKHLKAVVDELRSLHKKVRFNRLFIAGTPEARAALEKLLPGDLKAILHGQFSASMHHTDAAITKSAIKTANEFEHKKEALTVADLENKSNKKGSAVLGGDATLLALHNSNVFELVVAGDTKIRGCKCTECGFASEKIVKKCSICQGKTVLIDDLIEEAVQTAILNGTDRIEVLKGDGREAFAESSGMGAFLKL